MLHQKMSGDTLRVSIQNNVRSNIATEQEKWRKWFNHKHSKSTQYQIGEVVFLRQPPIHTGESVKLQTKYREPLVIIKVLPKNVYQVSEMVVKEGRRYATTAHVSHLKGYHLGQDPDDIPLQKMIQTTMRKQTTRMMIQTTMRMQTSRRMNRKKGRATIHVGLTTISHNEEKIKCINCI